MAATAIPPPVMQAQPAVMAAATPPANPGEVFPNSSLYVGDLDPAVTENKLYELFSQVAPVVSVRICTDLTHRSLEYAYVNFNNPIDASNARDALNCTYVEGKPIRIMFSHRDPSFRKSGIGNVYIKNLDPTIDTKALHATFSAFGTVLSCKVALDHNEQSKGFGFVQFDKEEVAQNAIKKLNGMLMNDKKVYVGPFVRKQERNRGKGSPKFTNVYVKNLSQDATDESLKEMFEKFGTITSVIVVKDTDGKSKCFGFVNFESPASAASAVEHLNGYSVNDKVLYVGRAEKKTEREAELKKQFEQEKNSLLEKLKGANLYLKNLDDTIDDDDKLKEIFSEFGTVTSCKLMRDSNGVSKGSGFVAFASPKEATKALNEMNGKMIGRKPLYVAVAQRKEERKALLQARFAQTRSSGTMSPVMQGYHNGAPMLPQQVYFGQVGPGLVPQAPAYGYQHHLQPPNFVMSYQFPQQTHPGQRLNPRRGGNPPQSQQQMYPNQGFNRYATNARNGLVSGPIMPLPVDGSPPVPRASLEVPISAPLTRSTLASALASALPDKQRTMLGEQLYPLVERLERTHKAKVTGMLLEMDQTEVLHLIESPEALKKKVGEAMSVLRLASSASSDIGDQLSSPS